MKKLITTILLLVLFLLRSKAQCFTLPYEGNGIDQMNIYFSGVTVNGANLEAGDVIAIFDGGGVCRISSPDDGNARIASHSCCSLKR